MITFRLVCVRVHRSQSKVHMLFDYTTNSWQRMIDWENKHFNFLFNSEWVRAREKEKSNQQELKGNTNKSVDLIKLFFCWFGFFLRVNGFYNKWMGRYGKRFIAFGTLDIARWMIKFNEILIRCSIDSDSNRSHKIKSRIFFKIYLSLKLSGIIIVCGDFTVLCSFFPRPPTFSHYWTA